MYRLTSVLQFINSTLKQFGHQTVTVTKEIKTFLIESTCFFSGFVLNSDLMLGYRSDFFFFVFVESEVCFC